MSQWVGENLRRWMARQGMSASELSRRSGLDRRTIRALLAGRTRPHWRTVQRLAEGLAVSTDQLLLPPPARDCRPVDRQSNPAVTELIAERPELFAGWTEGDFDELFSRVGTGGPLSRQGALQAVRHMNRNRRAQEQLTLLLETSLAEPLRRLIDALARLVVEPSNPPEKPPRPPRPGFVPKKRS
jgi:transcriptional regulator with XRE-family HTH domain